MTNSYCPQSMDRCPGRRNDWLSLALRQSHSLLNAWLALVAKRQLRRVRLWERADSTGNDGGRP